MVPPSPVPPRFSPSPTSPNPHSSLLPLIRKQTRVYRRGRLKKNKQIWIGYNKEKNKEPKKNMKHIVQSTYIGKHRNRVKTQNQEPQYITKRPVGQEKKRISTKAVRFQSVFSITIWPCQICSLYHRWWILRAWDMNQRALGEGGVLEWP